MSIIIGAVLLIVAVGAYISFNTPIEPEPLLPLDTSNQAELSTDQTFSIIEEEEIPYYKNAAGFLARPSEEGTYPALILIHEWWGLNEDIRSITRNFAEEGYVALAVDMYQGVVTTEPTEARTLSSAVRTDVDSAFENLGAAVEYLRGRPEVEPEKLASVGWCFGGGWAYQMALNGLAIDASVMYYGQFNPDDDYEMMRADILGHFGENDASIAIDNVRELQAALATTNGKHEVYIYPNVGHGFANVRGGDNLAYSKEASDIAWTRTGEFLKSVFKE